MPEASTSVFLLWAGWRLTERRQPVIEGGAAWLAATTDTPISFASNTSTTGAFGNNPGGAEAKQPSPRTCTRIWVCDRCTSCVCAQSSRINMADERDILMRSSQKVTVFGSGTFGTALGTVVARNGYAVSCGFLTACIDWACIFYKRVYSDMMIVEFLSTRLYGH